MSIGDPLKWLKLDPKYLLAISLFCGLLLFLPEELLQQIGVIAFRDHYRPLIGFAFLIFSGLLLTHLLFAIGQRAWREVGRRVRLREGQKALERLTIRERKILGHYVENQTTTQRLSIEDGVVNGLVGKRILFVASPYSRTEPWTGKFYTEINLERWAWDYLKKHPHLVQLPAADENPDRQSEAQA
jgi:hypothetical protein